MAPFAHYAISTTRAQDSAVSYQKSVPRIMAGNCRVRDFHWHSKWRSIYGTQCSAGNCLNYMGMSKVSFISLFPQVAVPINTCALRYVIVMTWAATGSRLARQPLHTEHYTVQPKTLHNGR